MDTHIYIPHAVSSTIYMYFGRVMLYRLVVFFTRNGFAHSVAGSTKGLMYLPVLCFDPHVDIRLDLNVLPIYCKQMVALERVPPPLSRAPRERLTHPAVSHEESNPCNCWLGRLGKISVGTYVCKT